MLLPIFLIFLIFTISWFADFPYWICFFCHVLYVTLRHFWPQSAQTGWLIETDFFWFVLIFSDSFWFFWFFLTCPKSRSKSILTKISECLPRSTFYRFVWFTIDFTDFPVFLIFLIYSDFLIFLSKPKRSDFSDFPDSIHTEKSKQCYIVFFHFSAPQAEIFSIFRVVNEFPFNFHQFLERFFSPGEILKKSCWVLLIQNPQGEIFQKIPLPTGKKHCSDVKTMFEKC